jgi:UPF0755 protein
MTIRSGGRPRERSQAHYEPDAYATESIPQFSHPRSPGNRGGRGGRGGGGLVGLVRFLIFAIVLGAIVLGLSLTALRPIVGGVILGWARDNPSAAMGIGFVKDLVRDDLGDALTVAAGSTPDQVDFVVADGDTATSIANRLESEGFLTDARAFLYIAIERKLTGELQAGEFVLRKNMTPDQIVTALLAPPDIPYVDIALRSGLRLEQITAKLQTLDSLEMDPRDFFELASDPPAALVNDYPWLKKALATAPKGASLEGFLWPATYRVLPETTAEELVRLMLEKFIATVGEERMAVPKERGLSFHQVLALASIVEREAVLDEERRLIAGVYQNRIAGIPGVKNKILNADPTVIWAVDTVALDEMPFEDWQKYVFWTVPKGGGLSGITVPEALQGYQTYQTPGLIPGPIATPTVASIDAALDPDTEGKNIYFLAIPDGGGTHVFAKSIDEHNANRRKYGYIE